MTDEEVKKIIQLYFDNELEKSRETLLFSILAGDEKNREYFRQLNLIHTAVRENVEEFPEELEERIFRSIEKKHAPPSINVKRNFFLPAASLGMAALMLIVSFFLFFELKDYKSRIDIVSEQVRLQNQTIELILNNSLPPAEVETRGVNEIIIKANL